MGSFLHRIAAGWAFIILLLAGQGVNAAGGSGRDLLPVIRQTVTQECLSGGETRCTNDVGDLASGTCYAGGGASANSRHMRATLAVSPIIAQITAPMINRNAQAAITFVRPGTSSMCKGIVQ